MPFYSVQGRFGRMTALDVVRGKLRTKKPSASYAVIAALLEADPRVRR